MGKISKICARVGKCFKKYFSIPLFTGMLLLGIQQSYFPAHAVETQTFNITYSGNKIQGESVWTNGHGGYWYSWGYDPEHNTSDYFWIEKGSTANNGDVTYYFYAGLRCHGRGSDHTNPNGSSVWQATYQININGRTFNIGPNGKWWDRDIAGNGCWKNGGGDTFKTTLKAGQTYSISVYVKNQDGATASQWSGKISIPQVAYYQNIQARYQNADGTWGNYSSVKSGNANYNTTYSWSRAADSTYKAASVSYKVTQANTKYVDVYRQVYSLKVTGDSGVESISGNGDYYAGSTAYPTYKIKTGYHVTSFVGQGSDSGKTWTEHNNKMGTINDTWGMVYNRAGYLYTAPNTVSIAYGVNGGTINSSQYSINQYGYVQNNSSNPWFHTVSYGSSDDPYNASSFGLTKAGYTFAGWQNEKTGTIYNQDTAYGSTSYYGTSTSDTTANSASVSCYVKAVWNPNKYTVAYNPNKGSGSMSPDTVTYNTAYKTKKNTFTRTGYTFNGWNEKADGTGTAWTLTSSGVYEANKTWTWTYAYNITLYAQWSPNAYTLTLNPNGGTINGSSSEKALNPPLYYDGGNWWNVSDNEPSRNGYRFMGWYTSAENGTKIYNADGTCTNDGTYWKNKNYIYTGNLKVYAHWKYITYYIQYDLNDSSLIDKVNYSIKDNNGSLSGHETALFDDNYVLQDPQPTTKYIFKGWNTKADGSGKMYTKYINQDGSVCSAGNTLKLYAIWETPPIMKAKDFYLIEAVPVPNDVAYSGVGFDKTPTEKYPDKMTKVTYPIKGTTMNGSDITDRIKIDYIELNGSKVSSISTNKIGKYTIHYSLTDGKQTKKFTRNITVLPASTPNINAGDKYFKKNTDITIADLKENITANDKYDGDLVAEVEIKDKDNINENESGVYEITYSVINTSNKTTTKKAHVFIIDYLPDNRADAGNSFRYIRKDCSEANDYCLQYFANDSKWNTDDTLKDMLMDSLSKADDQAPIKKYSFKAKDVEKTKKTK